MPILIVVDPGLLMQWASEIRSISTILRVFIYYGDLRGQTDIGLPQINRRLKRDDEIFNGSPINSRTVIVTTPQTMNQRLGPGAVKTWLSNNSKSCPQNILFPPADFPFNLRECFRNIIIIPKPDLVAI